MGGSRERGGSAQWDMTSGGQADRIPRSRARQTLRPVRVDQRNDGLELRYLTSGAMHTGAGRDYRVQ